MSREAYTKNIKPLHPEGTLIQDNGPVHTRETDMRFKTFHVPTTRCAEKLGGKMMADKMMMGCYPR